MENKKLWFKAKKYGWGWYIASWEGWAILGLYTIAMVLHIMNIDSVPNTLKNIIVELIGPFVINTAFLLTICYARGEKPRWRWGDK